MADALSQEQDNISKLLDEMQAMLALEDSLIIEIRRVEKKMEETRTLINKIESNLIFKDDLASLIRQLKEYLNMD
jgi:hypothetical protein